MLTSLGIKSSAFLRVEHPFARKFEVQIFLTCLQQVGTLGKKFRNSVPDVSCHQQKGASEGIPAIHGMDAEVFVALMLAYRAKEMENPVMRMIAGRLNDEQIGSLALYFSQLEPPK